VSNISGGNVRLAGFASATRFLKDDELNLNRVVHGNTGLFDRCGIVSALDEQEFGNWEHSS
jgi:hypothetical protein